MQEETTKPVDSQRFHFLILIMFLESQISKMNNSTISLSQKGGSQKRPRVSLILYIDFVGNNLFIRKTKRKCSKEIPECKRFICFRTNLTIYCF